ncbi:MAG: hypothetical protein RDV48_16490 [Candidatus Eremiobacteraeota bacterium]|nr:hypothetical protein [Candidatus Eremiobacteraeota bacterium]
MRIFRFLSLAVLLAFLAVALSPGGASAKIARDLDENLPVAIVATNFDNVEIQLPKQEWRKCYLLDLLPPETKFRVGKGGKLSIIYFFDDHMEVARENAEGTVAFRNISPYNGTVDKLKPRASTSDGELPYMMFNKLRKDFYKNVNDPGEEDREKMIASSWVKNWTFPPVFYWYDLKTPPYRLQLFDENDVFKYEKESMEPTFKYPYSDPSLTKGTGLYYWQVLTKSNDLLVRKTPFKILTLYQARDVLSREKEFERLKQKDPKFDSIAYTEMFILYSQYTCWDKLLHLCDEIKDKDPQNPVIYDILARLYVIKGCPIYSLRAHEKATQLGSTDVILD